MILAGPEQAGRAVGSGSGTGNGAPVGAGRALVPEQSAEADAPGDRPEPDQPEG